MRDKFDFQQHCREGARKVLVDCLGLKKGNAVALFFDEDTRHPAAVLKKVAVDLGLQVFSLKSKKAEQAAFSSAKGLKNKEESALTAARGILTCLSNHTEGTAYRMELIKRGTDIGTRLGHMPGINLDVLAKAVNIDYSLAAAMCDDLALAFTLGRKVLLQSYLFDKDGKQVHEYNLTFDLGGLDRSPISSTGIIPLGTWGNLPGGETFIAPIEDTANGDFVLNGAFKNYVFKPSEALILKFEDGRLTRVSGAQKARRIFEQKILRYAKARRDKNFSALAELGVGVNPGIPELTGNALFDEKCYGTAHIAIGDSARYGGKYESCIHEDFISRSPSLWIDDKPILLKGRFAFEASAWRESLMSSAGKCLLDKTLQNEDFVIQRTTIEGHRGESGMLRVRREVCAGRLCEYTIGEVTTSNLLANLYGLVPYLENSIRFRELTGEAKAQLGLEPGMIRDSLFILMNHGLVDIKQLQ